MTDATTAALQTLIKQVETLTTTVSDQAKRLDDLHTFNTRILDEKKDMQRQLTAQQAVPSVHNDEEHDRKMRAANFDQDANGNWYLKGTRPKHAISREDARDPVKYREAKAAAQKDGTTVTVIDDGDGDPMIRNTGQTGSIQSKVFTFDDDFERVRYVRADMDKGSGLVHRRLQAEQEGFTYKTFRTLDDLPPHARTKFELMERAANADGNT